MQWKYVLNMDVLFTEMALCIDTFYMDELVIILIDITGIL